MVEQDVVLADAVEMLAPLARPLGVPGAKGRNFMSGRSTQSGTCIRRTRFTGRSTR